MFYENNFNGISLIDDQNQQHASIMIKGDNQTPTDS
jgi:hypothetical protein